MGQVYTAVTQSPNWANTVLIFNRDEWGGFFDTVPPPRVVAPNNIDTDMIGGQVLLGCRVPTIVVSPFSVGSPATPRIDPGLYDHTSVLKLIEEKWNLPPLTRRDAAAVSPLGALDLTAPPAFLKPPLLPDAKGGPFTPS